MFASPWKVLLFYFPLLWLLCKGKRLFNSFFVFALVNFYWNSCHYQSLRLYPFPLSQSTASISSLMAPIPNRPNCFPSNRPPSLLDDFYSTTSSRPLPSLCRPQVGLPDFPVLAPRVSIYTYPSSFPPNPSFPWFLQLGQIGDKHLSFSLFTPYSLPEI